MDILSTSSSPVSLQGYTYQLNKNGHRTQISELSGRTLTNTFDALHRLTAESIVQSGPGILPGTITHPTGTLSYSYDSVGNRQSRTTTGSATLASLLPNQSQSFTANDRLTSDTYDANGNTTQSVPAVPAGSSTTVTDVYSFDNKLIRRTSPNGQTIDLTYNPDGHRLAKLIAQGGLTQRLHHYLTDANNPTGYAQVIEEKDPLDSTNPLRKVHLYGHDLISSSVYQPSTLNSQQFFYSYDGLGSVRSISDESGNLEETYDYDAYGTLIGLAKRNATSGDLESSPIINNSSPITKSEFLFTGEQIDSDLEMCFLRARYLNTNTGRFHSQDTYEGRNGDPLTLHKYLYVHGNPAMGTDPSGNFILTDMSLAQKFLVGGVVGAIVSYAGYKLVFEEQIAIIRANQYLETVRRIMLTNLHIENDDGRMTNAILHATASAIFAAEHGKKQALLGMQGREISESTINDPDTGRITSLFAKMDRHNNEQGAGYGGTDLASYLKSLNLMWIVTPRRVDIQVEDKRIGPYPDTELIDNLVNALKYQSPFRSATTNNL